MAVTRRIARIPNEPDAQFREVYETCGSLDVLMAAQRRRIVNAQLRLHKHQARQTSVAGGRARDADLFSLQFGDGNLFYE